MPPDTVVPDSRRSMVPLLVALLVLALTFLVFERIRTADEEALDAALNANAAQLGLIVLSLGSGLEIDLTSTVEVALATGADPEAYRSQADEGSGDRALLSFDEGLEIVAVGALDPGAAATMTETIGRTIREPAIEAQLSELAETGGFAFVRLGAAERGLGSLLLAAGATDGQRSYVEVRLFELGPAGPAIAELVDGIETFAVYIGDEPDLANAVLASTAELPLTGNVAYSSIEISDQPLLIEVQGSIDGSIPPLAILAVGGVVSAALGVLLGVSQRRRDRAIDALETARHATAARARLESDLQQTQRMEAVGQLAGGIAHDFNNLLAAITSTVELVAEDVSDPRTLEDLDEIRHAARRGASLTRRLLSFSRRDVEACEPLDLNHVIGDMASLLRRSISEDVSMELDLTPEPVPIQGDTGELEQVLLNLVVNARDAASGPDHHISISTCVDGDRAVLTVRDTGTGMKGEVIARAFEPFFSTKETSDGTGLGLAIVYGIVKRMDGEVRIESVPSEGTAVVVSLPYDRSGSDEPEPVAIETPTASSDDRLLILLVEDEATVRRSTKRLLERAGHRVIDMAAGVDAVGVVEDGLDPDVLITDVVLAGSLNGRDVASRVQQMVPRTRVVFISGYPSEIITRRQLIDDGASFLPKPYDNAALLGALRVGLEVGAEG